MRSLRRWTTGDPGAATGLGRVPRTATDHPGSTTLAGDRAQGQEDEMLSVGDVVDDFEAVDHTGQTVSLRDLVAEGPLVLFFFIKAKTPG
jgi:hypothetical protein